VIDGPGRGRCKYLDRATGGLADGLLGGYAMTQVLEEGKAGTERLG
jgi:hypothetical protein